MLCDTFSKKINLLNVLISLNVCYAFIKDQKSNKQTKKEDKHQTEAYEQNACPEAGYPVNTLDRNLKVVCQFPHNPLQPTLSPSYKALHGQGAEMEVGAAFRRRHSGQFSSTSSPSAF